MPAASRLYLRQLEVGPMQNFVYLIGDRDTHEAVVVDAAWDVDAIIEQAARDDMRIVGGLVTHFHPDHLGGAMMGMQIQGAAELVGKLPVKVYLHKSEGPFANRIAGLSDSDMVLTEGGDEVAVGELKVKFLHTPGHTPGSQCFLVDGNLVSGDTLFIGSCGRVDLPGSSPEQLFHSLNHTLKALPADTVLYPGHNYAERTSSTIGDEKRRNPYMRFERLQDFLSIMGY
jgi:glyoxylase-like metal-dependent hydrolase (beta-lactamase superfamily II)